MALHLVAALSWPGRAPVPFPVDPFSRTCLLQGVDELGYLQSFLPKVRAYEDALA